MRNSKSFEVRRKRREKMEGSIIKGELPLGDKLGVKFLKYTLYSYERDIQAAARSFYHTLNLSFPDESLTYNIS